MFDGSCKTACIWSFVKRDAQARGIPEDRGLPVFPFSSAAQRTPGVYVDINLQKQADATAHAQNLIGFDPGRGPDKGVIVEGHRDAKGVVHIDRVTRDATPEEKLICGCAKRGPYCITRWSHAGMDLPPGWHAFEMAGALEAYVSPTALKGRRRTVWWMPEKRWHCGSGAVGSLRDVLMAEYGFLWDPTCGPTGQYISQRGAGRIELAHGYWRVVTSRRADNVDVHQSIWAAVAEARGPSMLELYGVEP